ncbi:hypothetical protein X798_03980 [Onchocerca flexuosa]|uniref:Uncharacterized protein n=1 Tax=Onchocerca flexuosa TaxID=387005 RepID=A0A238BUM9_9BILA|nr:hypothetical protein X798_03980 [Onchocerca flexuosa]
MNACTGYQKPTEDGPEPEADATFSLPKAKKPATESKKPDAKPQKKSKEPDDEEIEPELVSVPTPKKPNLKLKDPEGTKPKAKTPLKVKPTEDGPEPEADVTLPAPKAKKKPESKKPKVKLTEDGPDPETDATLALPRKKPEDKEQDEPEEPDENSEISSTVPESPTDNKASPEDKENVPRKKRPRQRKKKSKPQWIPPPRPPPEPYIMPPEEKKLVDILKEEKIPPTKRYARKPQHLDVFIPFEIPWENLPALQTQEGMGSFGHTRGASIKVDQGSKDLVQGDLHSETVIPLFSQAVGDNRSGMLPFGSYRRNISDLKESNRLIPKLMQGAIQPQNAETLFGQIRNQISFFHKATPNVKYLDYMSPSCDPGSHGFISRQFAPTSTEKAGSTIMDRRRNVIANAQGTGNDIGVFDRASESIMPLLFNVQDIYLKSGTDFGAFRPLISESEGGYRMTLDDEMKCKLIVPYQTSPSLAT